MTDKEKLEADKSKELADEVMHDFRRRQEERRRVERGWQLNMNFLSGNQYCDINLLGEIENNEGGYFWQERRVFNHIAPVFDTRCSKLEGVRPKLTVRPASEDESDRRSAKLASAVLQAVYEDCNTDSLISSATAWSESCGTVFYKVIWDFNAGSEIGCTDDGESVKEGKVKLLVVSPFEIYPDCLSEENLYNQPSLIHARAVPVEDIYAAYGVMLQGRDIYDFSLSPTTVASHDALYSGRTAAAVRHGYETVIERYIRPNSAYPDGRLTIVAGGQVLFDGALPYVNGEYGTRIYPFVKQQSLPQTGNFFGVSVIDRLIPLQRAYNAVKNRKHEFLNRISMGTVAVEDGSVDIDALEENGLVPGGVLVYRQGGTPPEMITVGSVPSEFIDEEQRLEEEFSKISGTTDVTQKANAFTAVTSATGLQLIIEQDEARLNVCAMQIKEALKTIGKMVLRLYKQFVSSVRLLRYTGSNDKLSVTSFTGSDITGEDVVLEADSDMNMSFAKRRAAIVEMLDKGLFTDDSGKVPSHVKHKLLRAMGYNGLVGDRDIGELHRQRCADENELLKSGEDVEVKDYDDHVLHVNGHTAYLLAEGLTKAEEERICAHINLHKNKLSEVKNEG